MNEPPPEVAAGIHLLSLPTRSPWLKQVNVYAIKGPAGLLLVDTGFGTEEALASLVEQLAAIGHAVDDVRRIVLTHAHPDHVGLARAITERSGATAQLHEADFMFVDEAASEDRTRAIRSWFASHGMSVELGGGPRLPLGLPIITGFIEDGAVVEWGDHRLEALWMPGHSPGLVCLYDCTSRLLMSSDTVLERITPNVSIFFDRPGDPLDDYLRGLSRLGELEVDLVLPGHGPPFRALDRRLAELADHHRRRLDEVLAAVSVTPATAAELAPRLEWLGDCEGWKRLDSMNQRSAVGETLAHLRLLSNRGDVVAEVRDDVFSWRAHRP